MKLLVNATSIATGDLTGIERFALRLSQELYRIDNEVEILSTNRIPGVPAARVAVLPAAGRMLLNKREYLLRALWDQTFFRYHVKRTRPDAVFFPIQDGMFFPPCKQIITVHDLQYLHFDRALDECKDEIGRIRTSLYRRKMPHLLKVSAAIIAVSQTTKQELVDRFAIPPEKIHVVHNGYDEQRFKVINHVQVILDRYGLQENSYFLYVGSILRHKNLLRLVQAFARLDCQASLVLAGTCKDAAYLQQLMDLAVTTGMSRDRLHYLSYVSDEDLPYLYNGALACVLPSLHEGFGVPLIEAMACGTPVITSNCSAMPEIAGDAARFIDPISVESIAQGMGEILAGPQMGSELKRRGLERAGNFQWSASAKRLYQLCKTIGAP